MAALVEPIRIHGLAEFRRALKKLDAAAPKGLRLAQNEAAQIVVDGTRKVMPRRSGRAAAAVKARSTQTATRVSAGSNRAPHVPWLDFGGRVGRNRSVQRPWRKEGRYLYPTYRANRDKLQRTLERALMQVVTAAGLDVD